jgi:hypothetical protein
LKEKKVPEIDQWSSWSSANTLKVCCCCRKQVVVVVPASCCVFLRNSGCRHRVYLLCSSSKLQCFLCLFIFFVCLLLKLFVGGRV